MRLPRYRIFLLPSIGEWRSIWLGNYRNAVRRGAGIGVRVAPDSIPHASSLPKTGAAIGEAHLPLDCLNRSSHRASRARPLGGGRHWRAPRGRENREAVDNRLLGETVAIMQPNVV